MSNEQEIAVIAKTLAKAGLLSESYNKAVARALVNAGYRKADEVHKETAKEILEEVSKYFGGTWLIQLYKKYGVEVK